MDWNEFASKPVQVMTGMEARRFLVLSKRGVDTGFTVQMRAEEELLHTQCWVRDMNLDDPAVVTRLRELVDRFIATTRELQGVASRDGLGCRSWREPGHIPEGEFFTQTDVDALDPGENPLPLDLGGVPALPV